MPPYAYALILAHNIGSFLRSVSPIAWLILFLVSVSYLPNWLKLLIVGGFLGYLVRERVSF